MYGSLFILSATESTEDTEKKNSVISVISVAIIFTLNLKWILKDFDFAIAIFAILSLKSWYLPISVFVSLLIILSNMN